MIYCIDLDNTIAKTEGTDYPNSVPIPEAIAKVNKLHDEGHVIKIFTGRGSKSRKDWRVLTVKQLAEWGVKYHALVMGKPPFDILIDDCAINAKDWMNGQEQLS